MTEEEIKIEIRSEELADKKLNDLLSVVDTKLIVSIDKPHGIIYIGGEKADPVRLANLKSEAEVLMNFDLWKILYETPKALAERAMFINGESIADLQKGKSMLFTLSTQQNIINTFLKIDPTKTG